jgi:insertion element IS1 protein InsB
VQGNAYFSDLFSGYQTVLYWPAIHHPMPDKSETYSVEGDNAELRHYLARLARRSRCFSRCEEALRKAIKLFVFAFNRRQLYKQQYPKYQAHMIDFAYTPVLPLPTITAFFLP